MYHRVADLKTDPWQLAVSPKNFEEHMSVLKRHGKPIEIQEMSRSMNRLSMGKAEIAVTFDDGYADNYYNALPILGKFQIPATVYVVSGATDSKEGFWWDEISRLILDNGAMPDIMEVGLRGIFHRWRIASHENESTSIFKNPGDPIPANDLILSRTQLHLVLWQILSRLPFDAKKDVLREISGRVGGGAGGGKEHLPMSSDELALLARSPLIEIGAHTINHPVLSRLSLDEQEKEIITSKHDLEGKLGMKITSFSYPHGDHCGKTVRLTRDAGFTNACTVIPERVKRGGDPFRLPRFMVLNWPGPEFEYHLSRWIMASG